MRRDLVDFGLPLRDTAGLLGRGRGKGGLPELECLGAPEFAVTGAGPWDISTEAHCSRDANLLSSPQPTPRVLTTLKKRPGSATSSSADSSRRYRHYSPEAATANSKSEPLSLKAMPIGA